MKQTSELLSWRPYLLHVIVPVILGAGIYLLLRARHLSAFVWLQTIGLGSILDTFRSRALPIRDVLPEWLLFSLPDGLWVYALTASMALIWQGSKDPVRYVWVAAGACLGIGGELGQAFGAVPGTFDPLDLAAGITAFAAALSFTRTRPTYTANAAEEPWLFPRARDIPDPSRWEHRKR